MAVSFMNIYFFNSEGASLPNSFANWLSAEQGSYGHVSASSSSLLF